MRHILYLGVFVAYLSSHYLEAAESRKYNKNELSEGSGTRVLRNYKDSRRNIQNTNKFEQKEVCKGKHCGGDGNPVVTPKYKLDKYESSGDNIRSKDKKNQYKPKNMNFENDEKYTKKVKKRLEVSLDDSRENVEIQRKNKKKDNGNKNQGGHGKDGSRSKAGVNYLDSDDEQYKTSRVSKKHKKYEKQDNDSSELKAESKIRKVNVRNKKLDETRDQDKVARADQKIKSKTTKKYTPHNKNAIEEDRTDNIDTNSDDSEEADDSNDVNEDDNDGNRPDDGADDDKSNDDDDDKSDDDDDDDDDDDEKSDEDDDDDDDDDDQEKKSCNKKSNCNDEDSDEEPSTEVAVPKKKVKYSIKFAHEKQKYTPTENDNILRKIHGLEKKKNKFNHDSDEDSSEEDVHPKRLHFVEDEEDY